jgi:hypothetical protein
VTEAEWLTGSNLEAMLDLFAPAGSERKLRLFACAICRVLPSYLESEPDRKGLELTELEVDDLAPPDAFDLLEMGSYDVRWYRRDGWDAVARACEVDFDSRPDLEQVRRAEEPVLADLLREIMGNAFRPESFNPALRTPTILSLGQAAYEKRQLPSGHLASTRLAVLADALEDAGCADAELLGHLRGPGPHVRGCWALDAALGKS